jgi:uncharacterized membrane protein YphA (DoxX/SURF4 family)
MTESRNSLEISTSVSSRSRPERRSRIVAGLAALLGVAMIGGGAMKLTAQADQVALFARWGLPAWFLMLVGTFEVIGGILLIVPATTPAGSLILSTIMVGALWGHVVHNDWLHLVPALVLLTLFLTIFQRNRAQAAQLLRGA